MPATAAPNTSAEQPPRSPSPPPKAPLTSEPGPRAQALNKVFTGALTHTINTCSYSHFSSCFPTPARYNKSLLESVWRQVQNMIESRSRREFEEIMQEKDVIRGLNELDRLVGEAKARKEGGEEAPAQAMHEIQPQQLYLAHLAPYLEETQKKLEGEMLQLQADNETLVNSIHAQEEEVERMVSDLEAVIRDLEGANEVMDQVVGDASMRTDARELHAEIAGREGKGASRL